MARAVFSLARKRAPCVIFVDEVEGLFADRSSSSNDGGAGKDVLTEMMQEWDGLSTSTGAGVGWAVWCAAMRTLSVSVSVCISP